LQVDSITTASSMVKMMRLSIATSPWKPIRALAQREHRSATATDCVTAPPLSSGASLCNGSSGISPDIKDKCVGQTGYDSFTAELTRCQQSDNSPENSNHKHSTNPAIRKK